MGKLLTIVIVASALIAGAAMYYLQVYGFYRELSPQSPEAAISLTLADGTQQPLAPLALAAIDADSSPIRFRACFRVETPVSPETHRPYAKAEPLVAPGWFDCFDARTIGEDLTAGRATAYLGNENYHYGIDRIVAVYPDGRAFAWHQINRCGKDVFEGNPPPEGCPLPPRTGN